MKKIIFFSAALVFCLLAYSFYDLKKNTSQTSIQSRDIVLAFITYNGYGNNLYIDNVLTGRRQSYDIAVTSILNIPYDTTYSISSSGMDSILPRVSISNIGLNGIGVSDTIKVYLSINPGGYIDSVKLTSLNPGQSIDTIFQKLFIYTIGTGYYFKAYSSYNLDSNHVNDTLYQYSIILPGVKRNVLFEEFTSNSSPASANNNPGLNNYVNTYIQNITAIKYHMGTLGVDSFYLANPSQQDSRRRYYYVYSSPTTLVDGKLLVSLSYNDTNNLSLPYNLRLKKGTPISMSVTDVRIPGDSIQTTIAVNIISPLLLGNYKLRINAVERYIQDTLQGTNGETQFYDVFRATYPDSNGILISTAVGNYQYQYTYYRDPTWVDSMIYTAAFIQNDNTKEVMNCAKGRNIVLAQINKSVNTNYRKSDIGNITNVGFKNGRYEFAVDSIQTSLSVELFEAFFPPLGWRVFNQDGYITFSKFFGANGPTIGGLNSVIMDFFDYNSPGQKDSMYSKGYTGLLSTDTVRFDYSYAQYNSTNIDSLIVKISTDGGLTFPTEIFRKGGLALATAPQTTSFFIPTNISQWRTFSYPLNNIVSVNSNSAIIPSSFVLKQNFPNPFNSKTIINYELPSATGGSNYVKLVVYDILGKKIKTLVNEKQNAGSYSVSFDGSSDAGELPSGIYFYRLVVSGANLFESQSAGGRFSDTKRMVLIK